MSIIGDGEVESQRLAPDAITVRGAREHNLKNLSVDIPRGKLVVITGVSGSGKSTLAFDVLFAEGQRRFLDCLSAYSRQFVESATRPDVDLIAGLPPTVSIEQNTSRGGGKSTVATVTEIHHFLRLLFAKLGVQHCPECRSAVEPRSPGELIEALRAEGLRTGSLTVLSPLVRRRKGLHRDRFEWAESHGFDEVRVDGKIHSAKKPPRLDRFKEHDLEVVVGRWGEATRGRMSLESLVERALAAGNGVLFTLAADGSTTPWSTGRACPGCGRSFEPLDPRQFSYNTSAGWCPRCRGFGELFHLPETDRGADADSVEESWWRWGEGKRELCPECGGARLRPESRSVRLQEGFGGVAAGAISGRPTIDDFGRMTVEAAGAWFASANPAGSAAQIARDVLPEIRERLRFLGEVGLGYLELGRGVPTLSGGEAQRIRLAAQLGSNLSGVLYVLDEPTIGLHARDNDRLLDTLVRLRDRGNSMVVVEHDEETMRRADHIIDLGPGAGVRGGEIVATGSLAEITGQAASATGRCFAVRPTFPTRGKRRAPPAVGSSRWITLYGASLHNLKQVCARFPVGLLTVVTGVSGSGKSTLIKDCLLPAIRAALQGGKTAPPASCGRLGPLRDIRAAHEVNQDPIGRTPRSTPATYIGFFDDIRNLYASTNEARARGYGPGRFSFNAASGRCPECQGAGQLTLEMNFLPSAQVRCDLCSGRRFNPETLEVRWQGKSIADVLEMEVGAARDFFSAHRKIHRALDALHDTGLDYLRLGQTSPTLSGGEAQRVKLVAHLLSGLPARGGEWDALAVAAPGRAPARDLFVLEEPTVGLHLEDVRRLLELLHRLVEAGHTVIVIEHHLDLIAEADWVLDLGPEGGGAGGRLVAEGPPELIARASQSITGRYLRPMLDLAPR